MTVGRPLAELPGVTVSWTCVGFEFVTPNVTQAADLSGLPRTPYQASTPKASHWTDNNDDFGSSRSSRVGGRTRHHSLLSSCIKEQCIDSHPILNLGRHAMPSLW